MKIRKIEIFGYGKWVNQTFDVNEHLQAFVGPNEAGKSSIMNFITGVLYGFPKREGGKYPFEPLIGGRIGGRLYVEDEQFGALIIERSQEKDKMMLKCFRQSGEELDSEIVQKVLYNVTSERYKSVYAFDLEQMQQFGMIEKDQLNRYLLSIGVSGSEQLLMAAEQFQKRADQIFTPRSHTRQLDKKLKELEPVAQALVVSQENDIVYQEAVQRQFEQENELADLRQKVERLAEERMKVKAIQEQFPHYQNWQALQEKVTTMDYSEFSDDTYFRAEQALLDNQDLKQKQDEIKELFYQLKAAKDKGIEHEWYRPYEQQVTALLEQQEEIYTLDRDFHTVNKELAESIAAKEHERQQYGLLRDEDVPPALDELERDQLQQQLVHQDQLLADKRNNEIKHETIERQIDQLRAKITSKQTECVEKAQLEQWRNRLENLQQQSNQRVNQASLNYVGIISLIIGVLLLILGFVVRELRALAFGMAIVSVVFAIYRIFQNRPKTVDNRSGDTSFEVRELTQAIHQQENLLTEITILEGQKQDEEQLKQHLTAEFRTIEQELQTLQTIQGQWLQQSDYGKIRGITIDELVKQDIFALFRKHQEKSIALKKRLMEIQHQLSVFEEKMAFYWKNKQQEKPTSVHLQFEQLKKFHHDYQVVSQSQQYSADKLLEVQEQLNQIEKEISTNQQLLQSIFEKSGTQNMTEFQLFWQEKEEQETIRQQVATLTDTMQRHSLDFEAYQMLSDVDEAVVEAEKAYVLVMQQYQEKTDALSETKQLVQNLEKDGTYISWEEQYEHKATETRELMVHWAAQQLAAKVLTQTLLSGKEQYLDAILHDATDFFRRLTQEQYTMIQFDKKQITVRRKDAEMIRLNQLSRGTLDQLYIALRLAFVKNTTEIAPLPLIIDDSFVNFDAERTAIMLELLKEISQFTQVFYFTFAENINAYIPAQQIMALQRI